MASESTLSRARSWGIRAGLLVILLFHFVVLFPRAIRKDPSLRGCDAPTYVQLAHSLAEGRGYVDPYPGLPSHTKFPPLFPSLLALLHLAGGTLSAYYCLVFACSLGGLALIWLYLRGVIGDLWALFVAAATALTPAFLDYSGSVMSEVPFLPVLFCALIFVRRAAVRRTLSSLVVAALAVGAATMTRSIGLSLIPSSMFYLWWAGEERRRRGRMVLLFALLASLPMALWMARNIRTGMAEGSLYLHYVALHDPYELDDPGRAGAADYVGRVASNILFYNQEVTRLGAFDFPARLPQGWGRIAYAFLPWIALLGIVVQGKTRRDPSAFFLAVYSAILLIWPRNSLRFLFPLTPFVLAGCFSAFRFIVERVVRRRTRKGIFAVFAAALLVLWFVPRVKSYRWAVHHYFEETDRSTAEREAWEGVREWLRSNAGAEDLILSQNPSLVRLMTGHDGVIYEWTRDPEEELRRHLTRYELKWALVTPDLLERQVEPLLQRDPSRFPLAFEAGSLRLYAARR